MEARKSPSKLRSKFATNFTKNFANFTLEIAGAYVCRLEMSRLSRGRSVQSLPKGPGRIKKCYDVLIHYRRVKSLSVEISCQFSPGNNLFRRPCRIVYQRLSQSRGRVPFVAWKCLVREEHSMDQYRSRLKLSENFERHWSIRVLLGKFIWTNHWSIPFPGEICVDQWS